MKSVLISIRPKWCDLIAKGKKTIEVRKTRPKLETPFKCYIYQTLPKSGYLNKGDGHVVGEFTCDCIDLYVTMYSPNYATFYMKEDDEEILSSIDFNKTCLSEEDFFEYGSGNDLYGWHISELKVYDEPKKLCEFNRRVTRQPRSWCYVESLEGGTGND